MKLTTLTMLVVVLFTIALNQLATASDNKESKNALATELEQLYLKYLDAARKGDVKAVLATMTSEMSARAAAITPELVKGMSSSELDPRQAKFIQFDMEKKTARLVYQQIEKQIKTAQAVVFKSEQDQWKIAKVFTSRTDGSTEKDVLKEVLNDSMGEFNINYAIFKFKVQDFDKWKQGFDNNKPFRITAGLNELHIWQNSDVPDEVVILFQVANVAKAKEFSTSQDLKKRMIEGGVIGSPEILFLIEK